ncbi:MAG: translation initiation factor IF-2 [Prochloron sp. SP5CPC1]|nr:translation initiation factor IF-2 [Candidatus Paraprochloron terpiosi SP5CPC1]
MNNEKVRIYDLSKELNLDNKNILEICEQLNVSVKNHSSTITESQAELVRSAAERYTTTHLSGKSQGRTSSGSDGTNSSGESEESNKKKYKQEILAIRKHNRQRSVTSAKYRNGGKATSMLAPPPPRPQSKPSWTARKKSLSNDNLPTALSSPPKRQTELQQPNQSSSEGKPKVQKVEVESPASNTEGAACVPKKKVANAAAGVNLKLIEPPSRQTQGSLGMAQAKRAIPSPVKKSGSRFGLESNSKRKADQESPAVIDLPEQKPRVKSKNSTGAQGRTETKKKERIVLPDRSLLQRPQRLKSPSDEETVITLSDTAPEENDLAAVDSTNHQPKKPEPKRLKRPTLTRPTKGKKWEEGEDDSEEKKAKSPKAGSKKARRKLVIEDEDEVLGSLRETGSLPMSLSLSVARPPKPSIASPQPREKTRSSANSRRITPKQGKITTLREHRSKNERARKVQERPQKVVLRSSLTVREIADLLKTPETEIIKLLFFKGIPVNITQTLELDTARLVAEELGVKVETPEEESTGLIRTEMLEAKDKDHLLPRPPVVTIMGHVDHGKTTLLDSIRQTKVAQGEAGGITQHIGAYHVDVEHEDKTQQIVFLDTPGHEAFTAMRARGTRVTDIAILVVAADDGVQPQTREAISHAKAAGVPIVVAINKIDKPDAQPERIKQELMELGLVWEDWGGDTIMVPVSALKGDNLDSLLEMIVLVAELEELSANPHRPAKGTVIEAHLDRTRGPVATLLVQNGTLRVGDTIVAGSVLGKIRAMIDDRGTKVEAATPSFAVEILGLNEVPAAGDEFDVFANEKEARSVANSRSSAQRQSRLQQAMSSRRISLSSISSRAQEGSLKELNLILKADVQGSVEAIIGSLKQLPQNEVQIRLLLAAPGEVRSTDVDLAAASGAVIIAFNTSLANGARQAADQEGVDIREYNIIYKLLDDIQGAMEGLLDPEEVEESHGEAEVRAVFTVGRGAVAGCYVLSGKMVRNRLMRVRRKGEVIYEGSLDSLKRIKEDVREVNAGYECGIGSDKFHDWQEGDIIEAYQMVMKRRSLSSH